MDVDFNSSQIQAVNQQVILSGSATKATVPDSNYSPETGWANARYYGSDYTGQYNYSQSFASSSFPAGYPIDNFSNYFMYFDWIGSANPEYPGGGNVHGLYLIDIESNVIPLTPDNYNLFITENTFVGGQIANILPAVYSAGKNNITVDIVDGGAYYDTIMVKTGSISSTSGIKVIYNSFALSISNIVSYSNIFFTSSNSSNIITDSGSSPDYRTGWLSALLSGSTISSGSVYGFQFLDNTVQINSPTLGRYFTGTSDFISYENTYFPLQNYDFIRIGTSDVASTQLDYSFNSAGLYRIASSSIGDVNSSSSLYVSPSVVSPFNDFQTQTLYQTFVQSTELFRIFRRIPSENFVVIQNLPQFTDPGFLVPFNFNPKYDVYNLAKKAGVIQ
jgi:hypothetical protein